MIRLAFAFLLSLCVSAQAQLSGGVGGFPGPGTAHTAAAYSGPGDAVSGATTWASCARAYTAAYAATLGNLCQVTRTSDSAQCILKVAANGFADLTSVNCNGNTQTIVQFCNATTCGIDTAYDQTGGGLNWTQGTAANRPPLTFSALNSLPGMTCTSANAYRLDTAQTLTPTAAAGPMSFMAVAKRTSNFTSRQSVIGAQPAQSIGLGFTTSASTIGLFYIGAGPPTLGSVTDSSFHSMQGVVSGASSVIAADGASATGAASGAAPGANQGFRICRDQGGNFPVDGVVMEVGVWMSTAFSGPQITSIDSNIRSTNGYCAVNGCTLP